MGDEDRKRRALIINIPKTLYFTKISLAVNDVILASFTAFFVAYIPKMNAKLQNVMKLWKISNNLINYGNRGNIFALHLHV